MRQKTAARSCRTRKRAFHFHSPGVSDVTTLPLPPLLVVLRIAYRQFDD